MDILKIRLTTYGLRVKDFTPNLWDRIPKDKPYRRYLMTRVMGGVAVSLATTTVIDSVISNCILLYSLHLSHGTIYVSRTISLEAHRKTFTNRYKMIIISTNN